jgi:hypothetical protein
MGTVSVSLPSDGTTADVADYNTPITTIVNAKLATTAGQPGSAGTAWVPVFTSWTIGTGGSAGTTATYIQIGKMVFCRIVSTLGTSGQSVGTGAYFTLPVTAKSGYSVDQTLGQISCLDGSAGYSAAITYKSTTEVYIRPLASSGAGVLQSGTASTVPFTWGAGDAIAGEFWYEAA